MTAKAFGWTEETTGEQIRDDVARELDRIEARDGAPALVGGKTASRAQFLADVIIAAVEGGTGYWAAVSAYRWTDGPASTRATLVLLDDVTGEPGSETYEVTPNTIATGIGKLRTGLVTVNRDLLGLILAASAANDAGDIDADAADVIVQAALFGEIVYG